MRHFYLLRLLLVDFRVVITPINLLLFVVLLIKAPASAEPLLLSSIRSNVLSSNRDLSAARLKIDEARLRMELAGRYKNPELEAEIKPNVRGQEYRAGMGLIQRFPLGSRLHNERLISKTEVSMAEAEFSLDQQSFVLEAELTAVRLIANQQLVALMEKQRLLLRQQSEVNARAAATGEAESVETLQLGLEADGMASEASRMLSEQSELRARLAWLMGQSAWQLLEVPAQLPSAMMPSTQTHLHWQHPEIYLAQIRTQLADQQIQLARSEKWEDIGVGIFGEVERVMDLPIELRTEGMVGMKVNLPLPFRRLDKVKVRQAELASDRAQRELEFAHHRLTSAAEAAWLEMEQSAARAQFVSNELMQKAKTLQRRTEESWKQGQTPFLNVLKAQETLLKLERSWVNALEQFHSARVRYSAGLGLN